jgi:16S rRNA (guanine(966)-N(2))-methyltransferase RsmD
VRIIAGEKKGHRIAAPRGLTTRPTSDFVRETAFNLIGPVDGATVLDVFAGSGALGLEALSRGARHATFVERARPAVTALRANIAALDVAGDAKVFVTDVRAAIRALGKDRGSFELVFADPPYADPGGRVLFASLAEAGILAGGAVVVFEHSSKVAPPDPGDDRVRQSTRVYGDTALTFYHYPAPEVT